MVGVAVEEPRGHSGRKESATQDALGSLTPTRVILVWINVGVETVFRAFAMFQLVCGCSSMKRMPTMDLMLLKPYFQGTISLKGAPF
ncbi:MAG: hypothetical protein CM1200mP36_08700 [Gammaproteobacteria bacterium]|nr:MAG: hypothetical protein CM1200mP36_08700 [Gammaproteobacteria bacterium]